MYTNGLQSDEYDNTLGVGYILETGALWKNSIGEGDIVFEFPFFIEKQSKFLEGRHKTGVITNKDCSLLEKYCISGNKILYKFKNLEPEKGDNIYLSIFNPVDWLEYRECLKRLEKEPTYEDYLKLADMYYQYFRDFQDEYFEAVEKAMDIKYPEKNLDYYEEILSYYTKGWSFFPDGKDLNYYYNLDEVKKIKDILKSFDKSEKRDELIYKIDDGFFMMGMSSYNYYKYRVENNEEEPGKSLHDYVKDIIGDTQEAKDFCIFLEDEDVDYYSKKRKEYLAAFFSGDYSFMEEKKEEEKKEEESGKIEVDFEEDDNLDLLSGQSFSEPNEQEKKYQEREKRKESSSLIVYAITGLILIMSLTIFVFFGKRKKSFFKK